MQAPSFQLCWKPLVVSSAAQGGKKHVFDNKSAVFLHKEMLSFLFFYSQCFCHWIIHASLSFGEVCVHVCLCVCELFLVANKDEKRGWIQAASVSGPERNPAVAWRWRGKADVKGDVCKDAKNMNVASIRKRKDSQKNSRNQPSVTPTLKGNSDGHLM